ncbi:MAG: histidine triad nucleotide-binding protein [bacterium]|nr:histidine triad nucleotide-binding protein [bacterium]
MKNCLFCKIIKKEIPSEIIYEDDKIISFKDIRPKAKIHFLIVPKEHIESVSDLEEKNKDLAGELILTAKKIAEKHNLTGYKLIFNVGRRGGQLIDHIHLHLVSRDIEELP